MSLELGIPTPPFFSGDRDGVGRVEAHSFLLILLGCVCFPLWTRLAEVAAKLDLKLDLSGTLIQCLENTRCIFTTPPPPSSPVHGSRFHDSLDTHSKERDSRPVPPPPPKQLDVWSTHAHFRTRRERHGVPLKASSAPIHWSNYSLSHPVGKQISHLCWLWLSAVQTRINVLWPGSWCCCAEGTGGWLLILLGQLATLVWEKVIKNTMHWERYSKLRPHSCEIPAK